MKGIFKTIANVATGGLFGVAEKVVDAVSGHVRSKAEERERSATVEAKIRLARENRTTALQLSEHDLQVLRTKAGEKSWKDEYVTILVSAPILLAIAGAVAQIFDSSIGLRIMDAAEGLARIMTGDMIDFPGLWLIVVSVSLGVKTIGGRR